MNKVVGCRACIHFSSSCECEYCYGGDCQYFECHKMPKYQGLKSFPFKKEMSCFEVDFWHSEFSDEVVDSGESYDKAVEKYVAKYLKPKERTIS